MPQPELKAKIGLDLSGLRKSHSQINRIMLGVQRSISAPLARASKNLLRLSAVAVAAGAGMAAYGLKTAGAFDKLELRLKTVTGSAEKAKKAFDETFKLFVSSPMELEPLIEARILLESCGVTGANALNQAAEAAPPKDRPVEDIAKAIGSMETEPLRRLGIEVRKAGDAFTFQFRDKAGNAVTKLADGIDNARLAALDIFSIKFGGGLAELAQTWPGAMSTFSGASKAAIAQMSDGLKTKLLPLLMKLNDLIVKGLSNGTFRRWGDSFSNAIRPVIDFVARLGKAFMGMTKEQHHALGQSLAAFTGFIAAWKLGFLAPFTNGLARLVASSATAAAAVSGIMATLAGAIAGYNLGEAIAQKFDVAGAMNIRRLKKELRKHEAGFKILTPGRKRQIEAELDLENDKHAQKKIEMAGAGLGELWVESFIKNAKKILPESFKDLFSAFDATKIEMPKLPALTESGGFAADLGMAAESMAAISSLAAPLRGFLTGNINAALNRRPESSRDKTGVAMVQEQKRTNQILEQVARGGFRFSFI